MGAPEKPELLTYVSWFAALLIDTATLLGVSKSSVEKDLKTLSRRSQSEGIAFLTKTLPSLGKSLDKALGSDSPLTFSSFEKSKKGCWPVFLAEYWKEIFDCDGYLREPSERMVRVVRALRQILFLLYKLEGSHSPESEQEVIHQFVKTDESLPEAEDDLLLSPAATRCLESARMLIWWTLEGLDLLDIFPKHGPGSVATGEKPWEKMFFQRFYESVDEVYSYPDYFFFNYSHLCDNLESLEAMQTLPSPVAKVVLVPKDSRGPRLISMEPLEVQWLQQGQMHSMCNHIESNPYSGGFVNFTDQSINRRLALLHSLNGDYATLDMKEASDRVSVWLLKKLFPSHIAKCLLATRSFSTQLPDGRTLCLKKFAPMGSSVCFPVEALIFWALSVSSIRDIRRKEDLHDLPHVYVYGDDLVVPSNDADTLFDLFPEFFLEFNRDKCCTGRFFRESCGMDAFFGQPVTPVRIKKRVTDASPAATLSYVSYYNSFRQQNLPSLCKLLLTDRRDIRQMHFSENPDYVGILPPSHASDVDLRTINRSRHKCRWNADLQRYELRIRIFQPCTKMYTLPDWENILRSFSLGFPNGGIAEFPHDRYPVPRQVKTRWAWIDESLLLRRH